MSRAREPAPARPRDVALGGWTVEPLSCRWSLQTRYLSRGRGRRRLYAFLPA